MQNVFQFESNLEHQNKGVNAVIKVFSGALARKPEDQNLALVSNPILELSANEYSTNIKRVQLDNNIQSTKNNFDSSNVLDISMETGTGKTYTYAKTIFELHQRFDVSKFIIVVPTLSIKAGAVNFLKSQGFKEHFKDTYPADVVVHVVESQDKKSGKSHMPQAIHDFVEAPNMGAKRIHVLIINSGMVNSKKSLPKSYDIGLINNQYQVPFDAIAAINPILIIDEPHKFPTAKKTWKNIQKFSAQYIIRYGATFNDSYHNLLYQLTAIDAFNDDLVKGVSTHIERIVGGEDVLIKLVSTNGEEAHFQLITLKSKKSHHLVRNDSLSIMHPAITNLYITALSKTSVLLSNGVELKAGGSISPFSYDQTLQDNMMRKAVKEHFKLERELLTASPRIKPLTLFFIDDIEGYRNGTHNPDSLKSKFEQSVIHEAKHILATETDPFYHRYLSKTLESIELVHGGYFSKDNSENDEKIENEINEILHDKESLLSLDNPRRFIFSKWTLREGWDNPNVFQICKLRSSGTSTSKLQEVGRGLRLPVNEFMGRVKDRSFFLNYYVDSTESQFVSELINEVNKKSGEEKTPSKLTDELLQRITANYPEKDELDVLLELRSRGIIDGNKNFASEDAFQDFLNLFPKAFHKRLKTGKIRSSDDARRTTQMRIGRFEELRSLWELINQKVILEYRIKNEIEFLELFKQFLNAESSQFSQSGVKTEVEKIVIKNAKALSKRIDDPEESDFLQYSTMSYRDFLETLAKTTFIQMGTLHKAFLSVKDVLPISDYLNPVTIRKIHKGFSRFLLRTAFTKFSVGYDVLSNTVHPTKFTGPSGNPINEVTASDLGRKEDKDAKALDAYLFDDVFYDSELEKLNIVDGEIESVTVFTKIPKNSIKIPVAGGATYSPDFAYIMNTKSGSYLNLVIETKDVDGESSLRADEKLKIEHAQRLFSEISKGVQVKFSTQFSEDRVTNIIKQHLESSTS